MRKGLVLVIGLIVFGSTACSPAAASPTQAPLPTQAITRSTAAPSNTPAASATATPTPGLASPTAVSIIPLPTTTATPTPGLASPTAVSIIPLPTTTPAAPTPVIPAGLYVTSLDIVPDPPTRGTELLFYATFANTTGADQSFRWVVFIYRPDNPGTSFGETTVTSSSETSGAHTEESLGFWKLPLGGPCENFVARVALMDQNNHTTPFLRPDSQVYERAFAVCAPSDLPSPTPALPSQPTPVPTPPPGLFVTDLRTDPNPPVRGSDLVFYPTFSNTIGTVRSYRWIVYIFNPDDPVHRIGETSAAQTEFPLGASEQRSLGSWRLSLGGPCQEFVARVDWLDQNNKANQFIKPDGLPFEKNLTLCPP